MDLLPEALGQLLLEDYLTKVLSLLPLLVLGPYNTASLAENITSQYKLLEPHHPHPQLMNKYYSHHTKLNNYWDNHKIVPKLSNIYLIFDTIYIQQKQYNHLHPNQIRELSQAFITTNIFI
jgi:hypothetical protein